MSDFDSVRRYYDKNTRRFLRRGPRKSGDTMHRAVKGNVSADRYRYQETLILERMRLHGVRTVVDLGCGVGSSLSWLSERYQANYRGITLSPIQADWARDRMKMKGVAVREGNYLDRAVYDGIVDLPGPVLFYAIESWLHNPSPEVLIRRLAENTSPGDLFVVIDDFPSVYAISAAPETAPAVALAQFRAGWHAVNLLPPGEVDRIAEAAGFCLDEEICLDSLVDQDRFRDHAAALLAPIMALLPRGRPGRDNVVGGAALRRSAKNGWISYLFRVWIRR